MGATKQSWIQRKLNGKGIAWNKGRTDLPKHSEATKQKMKLTHKGKLYHPMTEAIRKKISKTKKESSTTIRGEKHHNWKGGVVDINHKLRGSLEYISWRNEVYKRDKWSCRICKKRCKEKDIVAHHLKLFSEFPELRFSVNNGITLCRSCHANLHRNDKRNKVNGRFE